MLTNDSAGSMYEAEWAPYYTFFWQLYTASLRSCLGSWQLHYIHDCWHIFIQVVKNACLWEDDFCAQWIPGVIAALLFCMVKLSVSTLILHESPFLRVRPECTTPWYRSTSANQYLWIASQQDLLQRAPASYTSILLAGLVPSPTPSLKGVPMVDPVSTIVHSGNQVNAWWSL